MINKNFTPEIISSHVRLARPRRHEISLKANPYSYRLWTTPGPPQLARPTRPPRPGPCLDFGFQYVLIRDNPSKKSWVEYWALSGSNLLWRPCKRSLLLKFNRSFNSLKNSAAICFCQQKEFEKELLNIEENQMALSNIKQNFSAFL